MQWTFCTVHLHSLGNVGAAGLLLLSWCVTGSIAPQVAALLLFPPEAADSVHGSAQAAEAAEASPHA